jgi:hypothetical protein
MVRVHVSLPLFSSPTDAFGSVSGELDVDAVPNEGDALVWPKSWDVGDFPYFGDDDQSRIWGASSAELPGADYLLTMSGFVCDSVSEARRYAEFFQAVAGFDFDEY